MTDLNDKKKRQELIRRYLHAETSLEEERILQVYFAHNKDELTPEEEDLRIILSATRFAGDIGLSDEKEAEFDKLMKGEKVARKTPKIPPIVLWPSSLAAAFILTLFLMTKKAVTETPVMQQYAKITTTKIPSSRPTSLEAKPQHKAQAAMEKDRATVQEQPVLAYSKEMLTTDMTISGEDKPGAIAVETSGAEIANTTSTITTITSTTVNKSKDMRYPLNVTAANYERGENGNNPEFPGSLTIVTKSIPNGNATHYAFTNSGNGVRVLYPETQGDSVIYIVDGVRVTKDTANRIAPDNIMEIRKLKRGTSDAIMKDPNGQTHDIILITTKKSDTNGQDHSSVPRRNCPLTSEDDTGNGVCLL